MKVPHTLRQGSLIIGLGSLALLCAAAIYNLWFIDRLTGSAYHRSQTIWIVIGALGGGIVASMDLGFVRRVALTGYAMLNVLLVGVLLFGREINHSRRWIELGPINVQPSEFMKLALVVVLAGYFADRRAQRSWNLASLGPPLALTALPFVLINRQPDLGTSLCVGLVALSMILYEGVSRRTLIGVALVAVLAVPIAWRTGIIHGYQKERVQAWFDLDAQAAQNQRRSHASQAEQALWAVGSGRIVGRSDDEARRSVLRHLPFLHTDFAFAAWAEQFGLVGSVGLFGLFFGLLWWGLYLAATARERFDALLAVGVAAVIFWQFLINTGMVIGMLPVVGMTLPIMSYGGSSVLTVMLGCGFLLNIALRRRAAR